MELNDVDAIYELPQLAHLGINPKRPGIDFARLGNLKTAINHWNKRDSGIANSSIETYHLWRFNPRAKSFSEAEFPPAVKELQLLWANPASLDGLPTMKHLKTLEIHRCRNLTDVSLLPKVAPKLKRLIITTSKNVAPEEGILNHPALRLAILEGTKLIER